MTGRMDRCGFAFVQELFCLSVVMVAISLLVVNLASIYAADVERQKRRQLEDEAGRVATAILEYDRILHEGRRGLFDLERLNKTELNDLMADLRIGGGFQLRIGPVSIPGWRGELSWTWSSEPPAPDSGTCVTSAAIQVNQIEIIPTRVLVSVWRS